jgi:hypothetical protein
MRNAARSCTRFCSYVADGTIKWLLTVLLLAGQYIWRRFAAMVEVGRVLLDVVAEGPGVGVECWGWSVEVMGGAALYRLCAEFMRRVVVSR